MPIPSRNIILDDFTVDMERLEQICKEASNKLTAAEEQMRNEVEKIYKKYEE